MSHQEGDAECKKSGQNITVINVHNLQLLSNDPCLNNSAKLTYLRCRKLFCMEKLNNARDKESGCSNTRLHIMYTFFMLIVLAADCKSGE